MIIASVWMLVLGLVNLLLFVFCFFYVVPRRVWYHSFLLHVKRLHRYRWYLGLILAVVVFHLFEVNVIDPVVTAMVGFDYAVWFVAVENGVVQGMTGVWHPVVLSFFVLVYIGVYPFTLWFTPLYGVLDDNRRVVQSLALGLLGVYGVALPFYLFMPVTNVYTYYGVSSALETAIPTVEQFFYSTTTTNNCFPSLHVAMTLLIAYVGVQTGNKLYRWFTMVTAVLVILAVVYLVIHWFIDVCAGVLLAVGIIYILRRGEGVESICFPK